MSTGETHCEEGPEDGDAEGEGFPFEDLEDFEVVDEVEDPDGDADEDGDENEEGDNDDGNHGNMEDSQLSEQQNESGEVDDTLEETENEASQLDESHEGQEEGDEEEELMEDEEPDEVDPECQQDGGTDDGGEEEESEVIEINDEAVVLDASNVAETLEGDNEEFLEGDEEVEEEEDVEEVPEEEEEGGEEELQEESGEEEEDQGEEDGGVEESGVPCDVDEAGDQSQTEDTPETPTLEELKWKKYAKIKEKRKKVKRAEILRKAVIVRPVRGDDVKDLLHHPCFQKSTCFNFRFLGGAGSVKNGHLEVRFVTEREAIEQAEALASIKLKTGRQFKVSRIGPGLGPLDGILDEWQKSVSPEGIFDSRCVFINNVPSDSREEMLRALYPMAISIHLPRSKDGQSQGYAMLEFESLEEAEDIVNYSQECRTRIGNNILKLNILGHTRKEDTAVKKDVVTESKPVPPPSVKAEEPKPAQTLKKKGTEVTNKPTQPKKQEGKGSTKTALTIKKDDKGSTKPVQPLRKDGKESAEPVQPIKKDAKESAKPVQPVKKGDQGSVKLAQPIKKDDKGSGEPVQPTSEKKTDKSSSTSSSLKKVEDKKKPPVKSGAIAEKQNGDAGAKSGSATKGQAGGTGKDAKPVSNNNTKGHQPESKPKGHQSESKSRGHQSADSKKDSRSHHTGSKPSGGSQSRGGARSTDTRSGIASKDAGRKSDSKPGSTAKSTVTGRRTGSNTDKRPDRHQRKDRPIKRSRSGSRSRRGRSDNRGGGNESKTTNKSVTIRTGSNQRINEPVSAPKGGAEMRTKSGTTIPVQLGRNRNFQKRLNEGGIPDIGQTAVKRSRLDDPGRMDSRPPPGPTNMRQPPIGSMPPASSMGNPRIVGGYGGPAGYPMGNRNVPPPQQGFNNPVQPNRMGNQMQSNMMSMNPPPAQNRNPLPAPPIPPMLNQQLSRPMQGPGPVGGPGVAMGQMPRTMGGQMTSTGPINPGYVPPTNQPMMSTTSVRTSMQGVRGGIPQGTVNTQQGYGVSNRGQQNWPMNQGNQGQSSKWESPMSRPGEQPEDLRNLRGELLKQLQVLEQGSVSDPSLLNTIAQKLKQVQDIQPQGQLRASQSGYQQQQQQQSYQSAGGQQVGYQPSTVQQQSGFQQTVAQQNAYQQQQQLDYQQPPRQQQQQPLQQQQQYRGWQGQGQMVGMTSPSSQPPPVNVQTQPVSRSGSYGYGDLPTNQLGYQSYTPSNQSGIVDSYRTSQGSLGSNNAKMSGGGEPGSTDGNSSAKRKCEVFVGNFPMNVRFDETKRFFDDQMEKRGLCRPGECPTVFVKTNRKDFTFIRFATEEHATNALQLDGIAFKGHILNINRPTRY